MIEENKINNSINMKPNHASSEDKVKSNKLLGKNSNNPSSKKKSHINPSAYARNTPIDPDLYYQVKEENVQLKRTQVELNKRIQKMDVALSNIKTNLGRERALCDRKAIPLDQFAESDIETLKIEKENLKLKVTKMKAIIQGLQTDLRKSKSTKAPKFVSRLHNEQNDYVDLINHLRKALKESQDDRRNLINDLSLMKESNASSQLTQYSDDIREKSTQVAELVAKYDRVTNQFNTNVKILELTKQGLQEYVEKYTIERNKNRDLEEQIQLQQANLSKVKEYADIIEEYKTKEKVLEERITDLCENPFIKQANERDKAFLKLRENELALIESQRRLKDAQENISELKETIRKLDEECETAKRDRDLYKEEGLRFRIENEEKEKLNKNFDSNLKSLGKYGEVESKYGKMLDYLKKNYNDEGNEWMNIDFLEKADGNIENRDLSQMSKEIERLKIEKGILGNELEKTKSLLEIQQQINDDMKTVEEYDKQKYQAEIKLLRQKIDDLLQMVDIDRLPKDYLSQSLQLRHLAQGLQLPSDQKSQITEFSKVESESDFGVNENCLDLYISKAEIDPNIQTIIEIASTALMSFISVDFFIHETQTSEITNGRSPFYNFQLSFRVNVDEHFLHFLDSDDIKIELYYIKEGKQIIVGQGKIALKSLLECEMPNKKRPSRVINNIVQINYIKDENLRIATLHYKLRMRNPIAEVLKWYSEKTDFLNEISPIEKINQKLNAQLDMINYSGKKVFIIKVSILKALGLKQQGQLQALSKKRAPYFYYKFFTENEYYSTISNDSIEPKWDESAMFTIIYDQTFHDYIEKESLEVYIFDSSRPLEVECGKDVKLVSDANKVSNDLIGICRVSLCDLLLKDVVQGKFNILNDKGQFSGELEVNIQWEEVDSDKGKGQGANANANANDKEGVDELVIKLAKLLRAKGLNLNSAFEVFDTDNMQLVSIVNFKNVVLFTLKFSNNQSEIEHLTNVVYKGKTKLTKIDFYKVFGSLLDNNFNKGEGTQTKVGGDNKLQHDGLGKKSNANQYDAIESVEQMRFSIDKTVNANVSQVSTGNVPKTVIRPNANTEDSDKIDRTKPGQNEQEKLNKESNRPVREIIALLQEYMREYGKSPIDVYKMFDRDANLEVGKPEFCEGLNRIRIYISTNELEKIWIDMCNGDKMKEKIDFKDFKIFYEKNKVMTQGNTNVKESQAK